ncbi:MAG: hypothetical protein JOZ07_12055 [Solirubrobacterales bacterium]|nr:hypothetical protein [Solirubrobacterales bacterium]
MTFADAAEAWLEHGQRKRNLKRSTVKDYRQALDAYLLPATDDRSAATPYRRPAFASTPLRDLRAVAVKRWYDELPYGRTTEKLLMIVRAVFAHARAPGGSTVIRPPRSTADPCATAATTTTTPARRSTPSSALPGQSRTPRST